MVYGGPYGLNRKDIFKKKLDMLPPLQVKAAKEITSPDVSTPIAFWALEGCLAWSHITREELAIQKQTG